MDRMRRFSTLLTALLVAGAGSAYGEPSGTQLADQDIQDSGLKAQVLSAANAYVRQQLEDVGYLVIKNTSAEPERRFAVVEVFNVVSRTDDAYTVQIDADEIGGEPRHLLFLDLQEADGAFKVLGLRIGPRHLRQSSP